MARRAKSGRNAGAKRLSGRAAGKGENKSLPVNSYCTLLFDCRGRCPHRPAQIALFLRESAANSQHFSGRQSRRPLKKIFRCPALCRGGRLCPPAEYTDFTVIFGKFVTSPWAWQRALAPTAKLKCASRDNPRNRGLLALRSVLC